MDNETTKLIFVLRDVLEKRSRFGLEVETKMTACIGEEDTIEIKINNKRTYKQKAMDREYQREVKNLRNEN